VGPEDSHLLSALAPHFKRASQIACRLRTLTALDAGKTAALDNLEHGIVLLDWEAHVLFANRAAASIAGLHDGVAITKDGLRAAKTSDTARLRRLVGDAMEGSTEGAMRVNRPSLAEPFLVLVAPARAHWLWPVNPAPAVVVFVTDPARGATPNLKLLAQLFGLTVTEARVTALIAVGKGVPETARALRLSTNTVHTHLQRIFRKVGVNRQAKLVRVLTQAATMVADTQGDMERDGRRSHDRSWLSA
jgi:DNA-binding CsgD family transcriptional regulator